MHIYTQIMHWLKFNRKIPIEIIFIDAHTYFLLTNVRSPSTSNAMSEESMVFGTLGIFGNGVRIAKVVS